MQMLSASASKKFSPLMSVTQRFGFARYYNRSQNMDQMYKFDMTSYAYKPELIYKIDPAPQYPDGPYPEKPQTVINRKKFSDSLEKFRDNTFAKRRQKERFMTGRLYSHLRHEELKQAVHEIHAKEKDDATASADMSLSDPNLVREKGVWVDRLEYDDQFKLPYGAGYDHVIKKRTDNVDKQKYWNNRVMDELVEKLGYMDFRDALACNKYILEVKRHGDYHQQARAKILSVAMSRYNALRRQDIELKTAAKGTADKEEAKLNVIMDEDPDMARLYRETYGDIK